MSKDLHNDPFEDFLRKNLKNHEENPSEHVWEQVAEQRRLDMGKSAPSRPKGAWYALAACVLFLLCALVGQQVYFSQKIDVLKAEMQEKRAIETATENSNESSALHSEYGTSVPSEKPTISSLENTSLNDRSSSPDHSSNKAYSQSENAHSTTSHQPASPMEPSRRTDGMHPFENIEKITEGNINMGNTEGTQHQNKGTDALEKLVSSSSETNSPSTFGNGDNDSIQTAEIALFPLKKAIPSLISLQKNTNASAIIRPFELPRTGLPKVEISATAGLTLIHAAGSKKPPLVGPGMPPQPLSAEPTKNKVLASSFGLQMVVPMGNGFRMRSGLAYERIESDQTFLPRLRFKDGNHFPVGGPNSGKHDFTFELNSGTSDLEVTVRAEDAASGTQWKPNDEIRLELNTTRRMQSLFVPIQLGYGLQKGRFSAAVFAGLSFQLIQKDELTLNNVALADNRLRIKPDHHQANQTRRDMAKTLQLHGLLTTSLGYRANKNLTIGIEPSYAKSFLSKVGFQRFGLAASILYSL